MDHLTKRELKENYKNRKVTGGIYCITCVGNHRRWMKSTRNIEGERNRYHFFLSTNSCPEPGMLKEWNQYGAESFSFTVLEEIEKGETQTDREFAEDIAVLLQMWTEKLENPFIEGKE